MANLLLTSGARFRPFTLEEYIKPYQIYTDAYNKVEEQLADLETQANVYQRAAEQNPDSEVAKMYQSFSKDLKAQADALATTGKIDTRGALKMKSRFATEIAPIAEAYKSYQEFGKNRRTMKAKDNSIIFTNEPTIDDFLYGNSPEDSYISTDEISKNIATRIQAESSQIFSEYLANGYSYDKALTATSNDDRLKSIVNEYASDSRYANLGTSEQEAIGRAITLGATAGLSDLYKNNTLTRAQAQSYELDRKKFSLSVEEYNRKKKKDEEVQGRFDEMMDYRWRVKGFKKDDKGGWVPDENSIAYKEAKARIAKREVKGENGNKFMTKGKSIEITLKDGVSHNYDDTTLSAGTLGKALSYDDLTDEQKKAIIKEYQSVKNNDELKEFMGTGAITIHYKEESDAPTEGWGGSSSLIILDTKAQTIDKQQIASALADDLVSTADSDATDTATTTAPTAAVTTTPPSMYDDEEE